MVITQDVFTVNRNRDPRHYYNSEACDAEVRRLPSGLNILWNWEALSWFCLICNSACDKKPDPLIEAMICVYENSLWV